MLRWTRHEVRELIAKELHISEFETIMSERGTHVISPEMITTAECRTDQSRFFAKTDEFDRVIGGDFG